MCSECPKKVCIDWKSLTIFNHEISFECGGWCGSVLFLYLTVFVKFVLLYGERVFGGWMDMYNKGQVGGNGLVFFIGV